MSQDLFGICPYVTAQRVLRGKWSIVILHHLEDGPVRFNELQRRLRDDARHAGEAAARSLEEYGVITRTEYPQVPPKWSTLSPLGEEFRPVLAQFEAWGLRCIEHFLGKDRRVTMQQRRMPCRALAGRIGYAPLTIRRDAAAAW